MHPSTIPNYTLRALKWPVALACILTWFALPGALIDSDLKDLGFEESLWLLGGAGAYLIGWILVFRHPFSGSYFSTFEHEELGGGYSATAVGSRLVGTVEF